MGDTDRGGHGHGGQGKGHRGGHRQEDNTRDMAEDGWEGIRTRDTDTGDIDMGESGRDGHGQRGPRRVDMGGHGHGITGMGRSRGHGGARGTERGGWGTQTQAET